LSEQKDTPAAEQVTGDINLEELEALESRLASMEDDLYSLRGTSTSNIKRDQRKQSEESDEEEEDDTVYTFGYEGKRAVSTAKLRKTLLTSDLSSISVHAGQLVAAQLLSDSSIYELTFTSGTNVIAADGGQRLFAACEGIVHWHGKKITISPIRKFDGDITIRTGNIDTPGSIIVNGSVEDGLNLKAEGDIFIIGNVGKAHLSAGGNIMVRNGIVSHDGGSIKAAGDIMAKFVEHGVLDARGNVIVEDAIMHSRVAAGSMVVCLGAKAIIVGGEIRAGDEINCKELGSAAGTETFAAVGAQAADRQQFTTITNELNEAKTLENEAEKNVNTLLAQKSQGELSPDKQKKLIEQQDEKKRQHALVRELKEQLKEVEDRMAEGKSGRICAAGTAHAGVKVVVGRSAAMTIKKDQRRVGFVERDGKIVGETYYEPKIHRSTKLKGLVDDDEETQVEGETPEEVAAKLAALRRSIVVEAVNEKKAIRQASLFLNLPEARLSAFVVVAQSQKKKKKKTAPVAKTKTEKKDDKQNLKRYYVFQYSETEDPEKIARHYQPKKRQGEVEITCESIDEGLKSGADALQKPIAEVQYKILQQKSKGIFGVGAKPYIIVVRPKKKPKSRAHALPADALAQLNDKEDGHFTVFNTDDGLTVTVTPPKGEGMRITVGAVKQELEERKYRRHIDKTALADAVKDAAGTPVIIGPRQPEPELDGSFDIEITEDKLQVFVTVNKSKPLGRAVTLEDVTESLDEKNIVGADIAALQKVFNDGKYGEKLLLAEGVPPVQGKDAYWDFKVDLSKEKINLEEDDKGRVDYKELNLVENVTEGQLLAEKIPLVEGQPGVNVYGHEISTVTGKDSPLGPGRNTQMTDDGMGIVATAAGQAMLVGKVVKVEPIYTVRGDVNLETGNINFLGTVVVRNTICSGFVVRAAGDIVAGNVEKAVLEADGDIVVRGGVMGHNEAVLKSGQDIRCKFVESANLYAARDVVVQEAIMHSEVNAGRYVICKAGKRGYIVGGITRAAKVVNAKEIGSKVSTRTVVEVGVDPVARQKMIEIEDGLKGNHANFRKVHSGMKALLELKKRTGTLPPPKQELLTQLQTVAVKLQSRLQVAEAQLEELQQKMKEGEQGKVSAQNRVYAGTKITVRNASLQVDRDVQYSTFVYDAGEVRIVEYQDLKAKSADEEETESNEG